MKNRILSLAIITSLITGIFISAPVVTAPGNETPVATAAAAEYKEKRFETYNEVIVNFTKIVNKERKALGLDPVKSSAVLEAQSLKWSREMAKTKKVGHSKTWSDEVLEHFWTGGENSLSIKPTNNLSQALFNQWKASPGHYLNMIDPAFKYLGLAFAKDNKGRYYATTRFGGEPYGDQYVQPGLTVDKKLVANKIAHVKLGSLNFANPNSAVLKIRASHAGELWVYDEYAKNSGLTKKIATLKPGLNSIKLKGLKKNKKYGYGVIINQGLNNSKYMNIFHVKVGNKTTKAKSSIKNFNKSRVVKKNTKTKYKNVTVSHTAELQKWNGKKWTKVKTLKKGKHTITIKAPKKVKGNVKYRIVIKGTSKVKSSKTKVIKITARR